MTANWKENLKKIVGILLWVILWKFINFYERKI